MSGVIAFFDIVLDVLEAIWFTGAGVVNNTNETIKKVIRIQLWILLVCLVTFGIGFWKNQTELVTVSGAIAGFIVFISFLGLDGLVVILAKIAGESRIAEGIKEDLRKLLRPLLSISLVIVFLSGIVSIMGIGSLSLSDLLVWGVFALFCAVWVIQTGYEKSMLGKLLLGVYLAVMFTHYIFPVQRQVMQNWLSAASSYYTSAVNRSVHNMKVDSQSTYVLALTDAYCRTGSGNTSFVKLVKGEQLLVVSRPDSQDDPSLENIGYSEAEPIFVVRRADKYRNFTTSGVKCAIPRRFLSDQKVASDFWHDAKVERAVEAKKPKLVVVRRKSEWRALNQDWASGEIVGRGIDYKPGQTFRSQLVALKNYLKNGDTIRFMPISGDSRYIVQWAMFTQGDVRTGEYLYRISDINKCL